MNIKGTLHISLLLVSLLFLQCAKQDVTVYDFSSPPSTNAPIPVVKNFLEEVLYIMETNSIKRNQVDWSKIREEVMEDAIGKLSIQDAYTSVQLAFDLLDDYHSALLSLDGKFYRGPDIGCEATLVTSPPVVPENIGYIKIPGFTGTDAEGVKFAEEMQRKIRSLDKRDLEGWIIDLRANTGGNMWAMIAGIGPILGEGTVGHFVDLEENKLAWKYENGAAKLVDDLIIAVNDPYPLIIPSPQVAVLTDNYTASAGEALGIAFNGRDNTRRFGTSTCGLTTANKQFELKEGNGEMLLLSFAYMADRRLNLFTSSISPDERIVDVNAVMSAAVNWILNE